MILSKELCITFEENALWNEVSSQGIWAKLLEALQSMNFMQSKADPCLYYGWGSNQLVIWLSWVDNCLICGVLCN
jgi:hypothetical protein